MDKARKERLEKLGITFKQGTKGPNDKIYFYNGKQISFRELGELFVELCKNEDENYPNGEGGNMLERFLKKSRDAGGVTPEVEKEFRFPKRAKN